ncbi:MAG TPA: hypothetical protein VF532_24795 [Candidatus Angelobacter sp.]
MSALIFPSLFLLQLLATPTPPAQSQPPYNPAFSLSVAPMRPTLVQGGSTALNIFIQGSDPASFRVRIEGIPSVVTADIPHVDLGASTIVLRCPPGTPIGTYAIQVTAAAGMNQQTQTFALDIKPVPPPQ